MHTLATNPKVDDNPDMSDGLDSQAGQGPTVVGFDQTRDGFVGVAELADLDHCCELASRVLAQEGVTTGQLDLIMVDPLDMAELNQTHMGHQGPTDVLSFPMDADEVAMLAGLGEDQPPIHLGDVVLCPSVAVRQAPDHCGTVAAELSLLIIHGVLHILGHDHAEPEETEVMQARERHHLANCGFDHPVPS